MVFADLVGSTAVNARSCSPATGNLGGGWAEIPLGVVFVIRDERFERIELYPPEAVDEMKARVAELTAERAGNARADR